MKIPLSKLKALILYFCEKTEARFLGKTKLMKLIYYFDFLHLKKFGIPVTFDQYVNLDHGPIPSVIKNLVDNVYDDPDNSELADIIYFEHVNHHTGFMHKVTPARKLKESELDLFSNNEIAILEDICYRFGDKNTKYIEEQSHKEAPWAKTQFLQNIDYSLAADDPDSQYTKEDIESALKIFA